MFFVLLYRIFQRNGTHYFCHGAGYHRGILRAGSCFIYHEQDSAGIVVPGWTGDAVLHHYSDIALFRLHGAYKINRKKIRLILDSLKNNL